MACALACYLLSTDADHTNYGYYKAYTVAACTALCTSAAGRPDATTSLQNTASHHMRARDNAGRSATGPLRRFVRSSAGVGVTVQYCQRQVYNNHNNMGTRDRAFANLERVERPPDKIADARVVRVVEIRGTEKRRQRVTTTYYTTGITYGYFFRISHKHGRYQHDDVGQNIPILYYILRTP